MLRTVGRAVRRLAGSALAIAISGGFAALPANAQTPVPAELQPPGAPRVVASLTASGAQVYVCKRDANNQLAWTFQAPQADLYDASGKLAVKHGAGPSWEAMDGSKITGKVMQHAANPDDADAIPMLLLQATDAGKPGLLSEVHYVQRLSTHGGAAPAEACKQEGQTGRSPYIARYVFLE
ncbi:DUF3455 domain-containing protein [Trinickia terrae]|uniref:DUF3455 domain-containing protein n=2 Tax=Trinickia terrae TaxID=2571161 RepID=A0A4U1IG19_9BURK|nr:DUF3455 domain-containing protein [Trinickia terrae]